MLVLSRKIDETIVVGEVVFTVLEIKGKRVTIGIDAPKDVKILRGELQNHDILPGSVEEQ